MNESHQRRMQVQAGLLNLLRPGAMLRFVYRRENRRLHFGIEGGDREGGTGTLEELLGVALETLRLEGLMFENVEQLSTSGKGDRQNRWIPVESSGRVIKTKPAAKLGFQTVEGEAVNENSSLLVPDFPALLQRRWLDFVPALLLKDNPLMGVEIEFTAYRLEERNRKSVLSLFEQRMNEHKLLFGENVPMGALERFLALWGRNGKGWQIRCRVQAGESGPKLKALLELIAGEVFETGRPTERRAAEEPRTCDLHDVYPEGWELPPLLPPPEYFEGFSARRILNGRVPRLPETGILLGKVEEAALRIPQEMRDRHSYIVGATGTGKSTLLLNLIRQDLKNGEGVILLDPHGDLFDQVLEAVPARRRKQLTVINPLLDEQPPGINFLDVEASSRPAWRIRFMIGELLRFFDGVWDMRHVGGPMFEMYFRNALLLLGDQGVREKSCHTLLDFASVLSDKDFRNHQLEACRNEDVKRFWKTIAEKAGGDSNLANIAPYIVSKMELLTQSSFIRDMIGRPKDTLRIREKMNRGSIILCNLSKGALGATESRLLGTMLLAQIFAAGLERGLQKKEQRKPVNIYVDEFQNFVSDNMASMLSEARKFGLRLILANQTLGQLAASQGKEDLTNTVLGNVGHLIFFRLGVPDAEQLQGFTKPFTPDDMQKLPNFHAFARILTAEGPLDPVVLRTCWDKRRETVAVTR